MAKHHVLIMVLIHIPGARRVSTQGGLECSATRRSSHNPAHDCAALRGELDPRPRPFGAPHFWSSNIILTIGQFALHQPPGRPLRTFSSQVHSVAEEAAMNAKYASFGLESLVALRPSPCAFRCAVTSGFGFYTWKSYPAHGDGGAGESLMASCLGGGSAFTALRPSSWRVV